MFNSNITTFDEKANLKVKDMYPERIATDKLLLTKMLNEQGINLEEGIELSIGVFEDEELIGTGSIKGDIIVCLGVKEVYRNTGLINSIITRLMERMNERGIYEIKVFTKLMYKQSFLNIGFTQVSEVKSYVLMEFPPEGLKKFKDMLISQRTKINDVKKTIGSVVMNCNPFTLGHRYLVEEAAKICNHLYIFVVEEDTSAFRFKDRMSLVRLGTEDIENVTVISGGRYMVSRFTFPSYFIGNENKNELHAEFDIDIFARVIAASLGITKRFVGTEPYCINTQMYNNQLAAKLPEYGIELVELERYGNENGYISASKVRKSLLSGTDEYKEMVHDNTLEYLGAIDMDEIKSRIANGNGRH